MHPDLQRVFDYFSDEDIRIVGSMTRNPETANDIDVLFVGESAARFPDICAALGVKYGGWDTPTHHVRKALIHIPDVWRPVHLLSWGDYDPGHCQLNRDGTRLHDGVYFAKESRHVR